MKKLRRNRGRTVEGGMRNAEAGSQAGHGLPLDGDDPGRDGGTERESGKGGGVRRGFTAYALQSAQAANGLLSANAAADAGAEHPGRGNAGGDQLPVVKEG